MRINSENISYKRVFILLYIIAIIIIILVVWKPTIKKDIEKYTKLDEENVDTIASEKYINKYINSISQRDINYLYDKLSEGYIKYNQLTKEKFTNIFENELYSNNLTIKSVKKYDYSDVKIYRVVLSINNNEKAINIIEREPNKWEWTMDDFYDFKVTNYATDIDGIKIIIDSVLQFMDKLELTCYVENNSNKILDMQLEDLDSVKLQLEDMKIINVSNLQVDKSLSISNPNTMSSRTFIFDIDITNQADINRIILDNLEINDEKTNAIINLVF